MPRQPVMPPDQPQPQLELEPQPQPQPQPQVDRPSMVERSRAAIINPMADVPGEKPLPALQGAVERYDCMTGDEDLHARIAFEARGGQVTYFAYYSKWKPRTCALDFERNAAGTKWRLTADGATRVHTPQGRFLIRTQADAYVFEFEHVRRQRFCRMSGEINGAMTVKRRAGAPECSAVGILDLNGKPRPAH
ncbi:MAG: hypothetical protein K8S22_20785 [Betaproteobacteria bacterium]|nr:hypothetical protein [Betaproteobacteria bacterium]